MGDTETPLIIRCDADVAEQLVSALRDVGLEVHASERRNLDGAAASEWIIAAAVAMQAASRVIRSLEPFFNRRMITEVTFGNVVLKNVHPDDAAKLITQIRDPGEERG